eukprot:5081_1
MTTSSNLITYQEYERLIETQCPLPPRKQRYINDKNEECQIKATAWFYRDQFWIKEADSLAVYPVILSPKDFKRYKKRVLQMRTVDQFLSGFSLTTSVDIYNMLQTSINKDALTPSTKAALGRGKRLARTPTNATLYAKKFHPKWQSRIGFIPVILRAALNAYFIVSNFITVRKLVPVNYRIYVYIVVSIEALLFLISLMRTLYNMYSLYKRMCTGATTHFQVKNIPENLRQMGSLSVMRYLPNGESAGRFKKRYKEWVYERKALYKFEVGNARNFKYLVILRWLIISFLDVIGPFVAIFSLLFKMAQLNFQFEVLGQWRWFEILGYFGFVNQVAGIRKVRKIEIDAVQHFVFSGSDIKMSEEEALLLDVWWNYTMVSCVANICDEFKYPVFDSIIFWYNLNVRRIQLLFKDHKGMEGHHFIKKGGVLQSQMDVHAYDRKVEDEVGKIAKSDTEALVLADHLENNQKQMEKDHEYVDVPVGDSVDDENGEHAGNP